MNYRLHFSFQTEVKGSILAFTDHSHGKIDDVIEDREQGEVSNTDEPEKQMSDKESSLAARQTRRWMRLISEMN